MCNGGANKAAGFMEGIDPLGKAISAYRPVQTTKDMVSDIKGGNFKDAEKKKRQAIQSGIGASFANKIEENI